MSTTIPDAEMLPVKDGRAATRRPAGPGAGAGAQGLVGSWSNRAASQLLAPPPVVEPATTGPLSGSARSQAGRPPATLSTRRARSQAGGGDGRLLLALQAAAGNRATSSFVQRLAPTEVDSPERLAELEQRAQDHTALRAGTPAVEPAPDGYNDMAGRQVGASLGGPAGLTLVPNAVAFTTPSLKTTPSMRRTPTTVEHFVTVEQPDPSPDVTHECYYLGPGLHRSGTTGRSVKRNGKLYEPFINVTPDVSALIRTGEQEHLDDAKEAYEKTYATIIRAMQGLAGTRFGPATTPDNALRAAHEALSDRLPPALSVRPPGTIAVWPSMLDAMLKQSRKVRDESNFHELEMDSRHARWDDKAGQLVVPLVPTARTKIPSDKSSAVINYPTAAAPTGGSQANPVTVLRDEEAAADTTADDRGAAASETVEGDLPGGVVTF